MAIDHRHSVHDRIAVVTGASEGIGFWVAGALARRGARVIVADDERGIEAVDELRQIAGHDRVELVYTDVSSVRQSSELAGEIGRRVDRIDVLVNGAGTIYSSRSETPEGHEATLATSFLAPFALTTAIVPMLSPDARIVSLVSSSHSIARDPFRDLQCKERFIGLAAYARASMLMLMTTYAMARRLRGPTISAVNPGLAWNARSLLPGVSHFAERAARAPAALACDGTGGGYYEGLTRTDPAPIALDVATQERAWRLADSLAFWANARPA